MKKAFSLVELLIVVAILGILAAVVFPEFQNNSEKAKAAAARDNLRLLRNAIQLYSAQHNDVPPGYPDGDTSQTPRWTTFFYQLLKATNTYGQYDEPGTPGYPLGPYLSNVPQNPFRVKRTIDVIEDNENFPSEPPDTFGWVYKPATMEIRLDWPGTDDNGLLYFDY